MASGVPASSAFTASLRRRSARTSGTSICSHCNTLRKSDTEASTSPSNRGAPSAAVTKPKTANSDPPGSCADIWLMVISPAARSAVARA